MTFYPHSCRTNENITGFYCQIKVNPRSNIKESFFFLSSIDEECQRFAGLERQFSCEMDVKLRV